MSTTDQVVVTFTREQAKNLLVWTEESAADIDVHLCDQLRDALAAEPPTPPVSQPKNPRCKNCGKVGDRQFVRAADGEWRDGLGGEKGITLASISCGRCGGEDFDLVVQPPEVEGPRCGGSGRVSVEGEAVPGQSGAIGFPESAPCPGCPDCSPEEAGNLDSQVDGEGEKPDMDAAARAVSAHLVNEDDESDPDLCRRIAADVLRAAFPPRRFPASHFAHRFAEPEPNALISSSDCSPSKDSEGGEEVGRLLRRLRLAAGPRTDDAINVGVAVQNLHAAADRIEQLLAERDSRLTKEAVAGWLRSEQAREALYDAEEDAKVKLHPLAVTELLDRLAAAFGDDR